MTTKITLLTPQDAFEALHSAANSKKSQVRVDREALLHLLIDYGVMLGALQTNGCFRVIEAAGKRSRPRLAQGRAHP